jgi:hypothetical protein
LLYRWRFAGVKVSFVPVFQTVGTKPPPDFRDRERTHVKRGSFDRSCLLPLLPLLQLTLSKASPILLLCVAG